MPIMDIPIARTAPLEERGLWGKAASCSIIPQSGQLIIVGQFVSVQNCSHSKLKRYGAKMLVTPFGSTDAVHCSYRQPISSPRLHVRCDVNDNTVFLMPAPRRQVAKREVAGAR